MNISEHICERLVCEYNIIPNHLLNVCRFSASKFEYLQVQSIEKVSVQIDDDIDKVLREREKYW